MAKELVIWCDVCLREEDERRPSATFVISFHPEAPQQSIDLCTEHEQTLIGPLREVLEKHGVPEGGPFPDVKPKRQPKAETGTYPCLLCSEVPISHHRFVLHLNNAHGIVKPGDLWGTDCPACDSSFGSPTALGAHISAVHSTLGSTTAEVFQNMLNVKVAGVAHDRRDHFLNKKESKK